MFKIFLPHLHAPPPTGSVVPRTAPPGTARPATRRGATVQTFLAPAAPYYGTNTTCDTAGAAEACGNLQCQHDAAPDKAPKLEAAAATVAPAPVLFKHKLALLKRELGIEPATPVISAVAEANQQMGITPSAGESLGLQLDRLLAIISS
eukprot:scaffold4073_cov61-Phaeocystis_antarctica.AAC.3